MKFDLILTNVQKHVDLTSSEQSKFTSLLAPVKIRKNAFILKQGQPCKAISFVSSGILRAFHTDEQGKEATVMFGLKDWWITDMDAFLNKTPATVSILAVENSLLFNLEKTALQDLYIEVPKFEKIFRILMQNAYVREQRRTVQTMSLSAEQRYLNFTKKYPEIAKRVSQKQIASYLGITPEFLSVIRRKVVS